MSVGNTFTTAAQGGTEVDKTYITAILEEWMLGGIDHTFDQASDSCERLIPQKPTKNHECLQEGSTDEILSIKAVYDPFENLREEIATRPTHPLEVEIDATDLELCKFPKAATFEIEGGYQCSDSTSPVKELESLQMSSTEYELTRSPIVTPGEMFAGNFTDQPDLGLSDLTTIDFIDLYNMENEEQLTMDAKLLEISCATALKETNKYLFRNLKPSTSTDVSESPQNLPTSQTSQSPLISTNDDELLTMDAKLLEISYSTALTESNEYLCKNLKPSNSTDVSESPHNLLTSGKSQSPIIYQKSKSPIISQDLQSPMSYQNSQSPLMSSNDDGLSTMDAKLLEISSLSVLNEYLCRNLKTSTSTDVSECPHNLLISQKSQSPMKNHKSKSLMISQIFFDNHNDCSPLHLLSTDLNSLDSIISCTEGAYEPVVSENKEILLTLADKGNSESRLIPPGNSGYTFVNSPPSLLDLESLDDLFDCKVSKTKVETPNPATIAFAKQKEHTEIKSVRADTSEETELNVTPEATITNSASTRTSMSLSDILGEADPNEVSVATFYAAEPLNNDAYVHPNQKRENTISTADGMRKTGKDQRMNTPGINGTCSDVCKLYCPKKIRHSERVNIFHEFWTLKGGAKRREFLMSHVIVDENSGSGENRRQRQRFKYFLTIKSKPGKIRVCRKFFLGTLGISVRMVVTAFLKKKNGTAEMDMRGKMATSRHFCPRDRINGAIEFIKKVPRFNLVDQKFIVSGRSITEIHRKYKEMCAGKIKKPIGYKKFKQLFKTYFNENSFKSLEGDSEGL